MPVKRSERRPPRYVLRELVLANGGIMKITPDVVRAKSFRGWLPNQIRALVFQIRQEFTIGEVWALYHGCIYAKEENLPAQIWRRICDRRSLKISGVANQNRIYEGKYQKLRPEEEAQQVLNENIKVLHKTMNSSYKVIKTLNSFDKETEEDTE